MRDNIYTVRQIEQLVNSNSIFPFWIDLNEGLCYVLSPAFSFSINELSDEKIEEMQNIARKSIIESISSRRNDCFVIIDDF